MSQISSDLLKKTFATWQHDFLSTSTIFYNIFARACAVLNQNCQRVFGWEIDLHLEAFRFFNFFCAFPFSSVLILSLWWVTFYWACKKLSQSIIETGKFYHGVAICSRKQFCSEFFHHIFEHFQGYFRLHWADHSDLGIVGKTSSSCRPWVQMMPILVKVMMPEVKQRATIINMAGTGVNRLNIGQKKYKNVTEWTTASMQTRRLTHE